MPRVNAKILVARHATALVIVLAVHLIAIAAMLAIFQFRLDENKEADKRITWVMLPPIRTEERAGAPSVPSELPLTMPQAAITIPDVVIAPSPRETGSLIGLGRTLSCNLANFQNLPEEEKARCAQKYGARKNDEPTLAQTAHQQELQKQFAYEAADKKSPPLLPCFSAKGFVIFDSVNGGAVSCVLDSIANGYDPDHRQPDYTDEKLEHP